MTVQEQICTQTFKLQGFVSSCVLPAVHVTIAVHSGVAGGLFPH